MVEWVEPLGVECVAVGFGDVVVDADAIPTPPATRPTARAAPSPIRRAEWFQG